MRTTTVNYNCKYICNIYIVFTHIRLESPNSVEKHKIQKVDLYIQMKRGSSKAGAPYEHGAAAMPPVAHAACPLVAVWCPGCDLRSQEKDCDSGWKL